MAKHNEYGQWAEEEAATYLQQQGIQLLARNYRYYKAEVDIIARTAEELIIVEVKARTNTLYGRPEEYVTDKKHALLSEAAGAFALSIGWEGPIRFDIIAIIGQPGVATEIHHIRDAFFPMDFEGE